MANQESEKHQTPKKRGDGIGKRLLMSILAIVLILGGIAVGTMENGRYLNQLRRWLQYGGGGETTDIFLFAADGDNQVVRLGESLLVVNHRSITLLQEDGTALWEQPISFDRPVVTFGDDLAAVVDVGGNRLYVLNPDGLLYTCTTAEGQCFYQARLNAKGWLAVTEQETGYKAAVTVYNRKGERVFHFSSHENYLLDSFLTDDNKELFVVGMTIENGVYVSRLLRYRLSTAERVGELTLEDGVLLDGVLRGDTLIALCDSRLLMCSLTGELLLDVPYRNQYLHGYALGGEDFSALLLGKYQSGGVSTLTTYSTEGEQLASLELGEEVLSISACGKYVAVLFSNRLVLYRRDLTVYAQLDGVDYATDVQMQEDGTALLISATAAWRYLP